MSRRLCRRPLARTAWKVVLPVVLFAAAGPAHAQTDIAWQPAKDKPAITIVNGGAPLSLAECIHLALERQPRIAAQRASLAAAEDGSRALEGLKFAALIDPEIPTRRRQSALGVTAAAAGVDQVERETVYAVTRTYFTVLYARQQETVARSIVERLTAIHQTAEKQLKGGVRDITANDVGRALVYLRLSETRRTQASQGVKRALAALREAIGAGPDFAVDVPAGKLPEPDARPNRDEVIATAVSRRGEMIRANVYADVTCLEIDAQAGCVHKKKETFAAGSDIHAFQVPPEVRNTEYRPGAVPPEMPTLLVGSRAERMKHAQSLHMRAQAVAEVTRNLIALEAEDAYLRWEEASLQVPAAREAAETGDKLAEDLTKDFTSGAKVKVEEVVNARVLAAQARSQYHEFLYKEILALADLERVTAGAFCAGFV